MIDCQQETRHLASMGAAPVPRSAFVQRLKRSLQQQAPSWRFDPVYWMQLFDGHHPDA